EGGFLNGQACHFQDTVFGNAHGRAWRSDQRSPTAATRACIDRSVSVCGRTVPFSTSSHVHGAEIGAPGFGRTAYAAANVAVYSLRPVSIRIRPPRSTL